jgi:hypothetical protein
MSDDRKPAETPTISCKFVSPDDKGPDNEVLRKSPETIVEQRLDEIERRILAGDTPPADKPG